MNLHEANEHHLIFELSAGQKAIFERLLKQYPVSNNAFHKISRTVEEVELEVEQEMLDEALAETRAENRRRVGNFLREPGRFEPVDEHWHLKILPRQINWLLQVLNEIRVGFWHRLGCPTQEAGPELTAENTECFLFMELSAQFQMILLQSQSEV